MTSPEAVTQLLLEWSKGDERALDQLMPLVYAELHRLASAYLSRERSDHTLQPTALVNEAYLRLIDQSSVAWQNRAQFFGIAAQMMRRILVNHARDRHAQKRGGPNAHKLSLTEAVSFFDDRDLNLTVLDETLTRLETFDPQQSRIIELRFFGGLTIEEVAEVIGISPATVKREWRTAKAWLYKEISQSA
ncbi:MAG: sigma-70 family RNA polymerase sigma factor [Pyrinomonadaceae bacterium]